MRRMVFLAALLAAVGLMAACEATEESLVQPVLEFRTALLAKENCTYSADVTADFGDRVYEFSMDCAYTPREGGASLTVTAPETIAGISAAVSGEEMQVSFEDVALELGEMAGGRAAPMQLPALLGNAWTGGYVESVTKEADGFIVVYRLGYDEDELLICTWLDQALAPAAAEVYYEGDCILSAVIENFSLAGAGRS